MEVSKTYRSDSGENVVHQSHSDARFGSVSARSIDRVNAILNDKSLSVELVSGELGFVGQKSTSKLSEVILHTNYVPQ